MRQTSIDFYAQLDKGIHYSNHSHYSKAVQTLMPLYRHFQEKKDHQAASETALYLGISYFNLKKFSDAKTAFTQASTAAAELKEEPFHLAVSYYHLAKTADALREEQQAILHQKKAIEILTGIHSQTSEDKECQEYLLKACVLLGQWLRGRGFYDDAAMRYFEQAWQLDSSEHKQFPLDDAAFFFFEKKDFKGAIKYFTHRETDFKEHNHAGHLALFLGIALLKVGEFSRSQLQLEKALTLYKKNHQNRGETFASLALGILYHQKQPLIYQQYLKFSLDNISWCYFHEARYELFILQTLFQDSEKFSVFSSSLFQQLLQDYLAKAHVLITGLNHVAANKPELTKESFSIWGPTDLRQLAKSLLNNTYLQHVKLSYTDSYNQADDVLEGFTPVDADSAVNELAIRLTNHPTLRSLKLANISLRGLSAMSAQISNSKTLYTFILESEAFKENIYICELPYFHVLDNLESNPELAGKFADIEQAVKRNKQERSKSSSLTLIPKRKHQAVEPASAPTLLVPKKMSPLNSLGLVNQSSLSNFERTRLSF